MKTAEQFKHSIGKADEAFVHGIRQTLAELECKEEKPVKKKISMGLVLAAAIMLLTVTAVAAGQWGILDFIKEHGQAADPERLVTEMDQETYKVENTYARPGESELVDVALEEILYEDGWLYAAMLVIPKQENTLVIADEMQTKEVNGERYLSAMGTIRDIHEPGSMKLFAGNEDVDAAQSVKEYADSKGFDRVVRVALGMFIENADYELLEDGSLRMIVQMEYNYNFKENHPKFMVRAWIPLQVITFDEEGKLGDVYACEQLDVQAVGPMVLDGRTKASIPEDAHQIEGYRGYIEGVYVTPISDTETSVILRLDQQKRHYGVTQMSGPVVVILNEKGEVLHEEHLYTKIENMELLTGDRIKHNIVLPSAGLAEDKITIRLQSWRNYNIIYDEYTYTLK